MFKNIIILSPSVIESKIVHVVPFCDLINSFCVDFEHCNFLIFFISTLFSRLPIPTPGWVIKMSNRGAAVKYFGSKICCALPELPIPYYPTNNWEICS